MLEKIKQQLKNKIKDEKLIDNLFLSYQEISKEFVTEDPVGLLQNVGLFVESVLRVIENLVFGFYTPLDEKLDIEKCLEKLKTASGKDGLRIHAARLSRAIYDFRSRKKSVHLKGVDPQLIDANLIFNIASWILIEILKESEIPNSEEIIHLLFTRKIPLVQYVDGIWRTTDPKLLGTQRILLLLYAKPDGLIEDELLEGTKTKIKDKNHLKKDLKNLEKKDLIHKKRDGKWILFGQGFREAEKLIKEFTQN
jgi:hypothetical protein